ncbi:MAG TPA: helicase associated domain-containing protein [Arthrobacter sp.]
MEESTPGNWVRLYRQGIGGAEVAKICGEPDVLAVLRHLTAAKRGDAALETDHLANLVARAREVEEEMAVKRAITPLWRRRLDELSAFVCEHGRMPRQTGGDEAETGLGRWLHTQRSKVAKGTLLPRQRAALDAIGAWDSDRRATREAKQFPVRLLELIEFRKAHRRWPTYMSRANSDERVLGTWLYTVREVARLGRLPEDMHDLLDRQVPGWNR